jgi:hypothetical protein
MSGSVTVQASPSKCNWRSNDSGFTAVGGFAAVGGSAANGSAVDGSFAATPDAAGNTKKVETISPLSAALVMKVNFIESHLPHIRFSPPLLSPLYMSLPVTSMQKKSKGNKV